MKYLTFSLFAVLFVWSSLAWSEYNTTKLAEAMSKYDACMTATYGMTSAQYYVTHSELPECK